MEITFTSPQMNKRHFIPTIKWLSLMGILLFGHALFGQLGSKNVYNFLDLSASARLTALGDHLISISDQDVSLAFENPALLNEKHQGQFSFNHKFYFDKIDHGYFGYGSKLPFWNLNAHLGIQYVSYGDFVSADIYGNKIGSFKANETALILGVSKQLNERIRMGINTKWIQSRFESYNSIGFASDIGLLYSITDKKVEIGFAIKNLGTQITRYSDTKENLPFDIQLGLSKRLTHLPFRFSVTAHHLHRWNIIYDDPNEENNLIFLGDEQTTNKLGILTDNLFRHLIISGDFLIGKNEFFNLRVAYNHLRRRELSVDNYISMAGFSLGFGVKIRKFTLDYGYSVNHLAGGGSHIGISMNINALVKKI